MFSSLIYICIRSTILLKQSIRTPSLSFVAMHLFVYLLLFAIVLFHIMSVWSIRYTILLVILFVKRRYCLVILPAISHEAVGRVLNGWLNADTRPYPFFIKRVTYLSLVPPGQPPPPTRHKF